MGEYYKCIKLHGPGHPLVYNAPKYILNLPFDHMECYISTNLLSACHISSEQLFFCLRLFIYFWSLYTGAMEAHFCH